MNKTFIAILFSIFIFTACGSNDKKDSSKNDAVNKNTSVSATNKDATRLEGSWEIKRVDGIMEEMNVGTVYEFRGDTLTLSKDDLVTPGITEITDSTFSFEADVSKKKKYMYKYYFKDDTLVAAINISGGQIFYMIKK